MGNVALPTRSEYAAGENADGDIVYVDLFNIIDEFNGSIESDNIANNAITTDKIANGTVTSDKLSGSSIKEANMDYTQYGSGAKVWRCGPNYVGTAGGLIARVQKTISFTATTNEEGPFTFNLNDATTDCVDGNPAFHNSAAPTMLGAPVVTGSTVAHENNAILSVRITAIDEGSIVMYIAHGATAADVDIEFGVAGVKA